MQYAYYTFTFFKSPFGGFRGLLLGLFIATQCLAKDVVVTKNGAVGDGKTLNSKAIQNAIDDCSKSGGGKVYLPEGKWLCGTILLKNGVVLSLSENAVLLGSTSIDDYFIVDGFTDGVGQPMGYCFVGAMDVKNVGIEGKGIIDGQGKLVQAANGKVKRPFLIRFVRCENISVKDVHLQSSTAWTVHLFRSKNIKVDGVTIYSRGLANNDGIDIDCCEDVAIKNCNISSDDDAICFKTTSPYPCKNIVVSGIKIRTNCGAIKFGTESTGDFQNIKVTDIHVTYAGLGIIKLLSVDGAHISNIDIANVYADTANMPILIRLGARLKTFRPEDVKKDVGTISNIKIRNVIVKNATMTGVLFSGIPGHNINDVSLENISINSKGGGTVEDAKVKLPEAEAVYPEIRMFGKAIPSYGLYIRHAAGLQFKNITFTTDKLDARPALIADDVKNLTMASLNVRVVTSTEPVVSFSSVASATLKSFQLSVKPSVFLNIEGSNSANIKLQNIRFIKDNSAIQYGAGVSKDAVTIE